MAPHLEPLASKLFIRQLRLHSIKYGQLLAMKNILTLSIIALYLLTAAGLHAQSTAALQDFRLAGDARPSGGDCIQLTPDLEWSSGSIWYQKAISLEANFDMELRLMLGCKDEKGADGMVFVFHPHAERTGYWGEGMGFAGLYPSLGLEVDTWENGHLGDPAADHVALLRDGNVHHAYGLTPPKAIANLEDCREHPLRITWDAEQMLFQVKIDGRTVLSYRENLIAEVFNGNPDVYWGITSATGAYNNAHKVCVEKLDFTLSDDRQGLELRGIKLQQLKQGEFITLERIQFESGSDILTPEGRQELDELARIMKGRPKLHLDIIGHTDGIGNADANLALSKRRANAVAKYLREKGIPGKRLKPEGAGEGYPTHTNSTPEGRKKNRRVEFRLIKPIV